MDTNLSVSATGNAGLDLILRGGLPRNRLYLLEGQPGSGKTTLALQYLLKGVSANERCLYVTLSETAEELQDVAHSHGWSLDGIDLFELASAEEVLGDGRQQSVLHPWELELDGTVRLIQTEVERVKPSRVVFDSLSELRLLAQDPLRYRRQILALKQYFAPRNITVILVDDLTGDRNQRNGPLHSLCHGVVSLERLTLDYGMARRRLQVQKLRGVDFIGGYHDMAIQRGGLEVFPRVPAPENHVESVGECLTSGVEALDALLGGGPLRGTSTLLTGPAGSGKTTLAMQYVAAACARGEHCVVYEFDERIGTLLSRAEAMGMDLRRHVVSGLLSISQVDPAVISPGEFTWRVHRVVKEDQCRVLVIDSLNGYLNAMPQEKQLLLQMHELLAFLNQSGVATFLLNPQSGFVGNMNSRHLNASYIADAIVLFRFFEAHGRILKAISVLKNRGGAHENTIRELRVDSGGLWLGEPLTQFKGVLTGNPEFIGSAGPLMAGRDA